MVRPNLEELARKVAEKRNDPENYEFKYKAALALLQTLQGISDFIGLFTQE